jgi:hypothetical protein
MPHYNVNPIDGALFSTGSSTGPQHQECWKIETERIQRVRGEALSVVFEVESSVDYAIGDCVLPRQTRRSPGSLVKKHLLVQNEILTHLDFRTKIDIVGALLGQRFPRKKDEIKSLISVMHRIRDVRNRMAHAPVYFEALERPISGRWVRPHLMTPKRMIHLSDGYMRKFREDAQEAVTLLRQIMSLGVKKRTPQVVELA